MVIHGKLLFDLVTDVIESTDTQLKVQIGIFGTER